LAQGTAGSKTVGLATQAMTNPAAVAATAAKGAGVAGKAGVSGSATSAAGLKSLAAGSGTIWSGKGLSLGLGLGLGIWGPILVVAGGAVAIYAYREYRRRKDALTDEDIQADDADEGFYTAET